MGTRGQTVRRDDQHFGPDLFDGWGPETDFDSRPEPKPRTREAVVAELEAKLQRSRQREHYARQDLEAEPLEEFKRRHRGRIAKEQGLQAPLLADLAKQRGRE